MSNFKLHPAPHQRLISWAAAPGFAILMVRLMLWGGGGLYLRAFAQLFIHDETKDDPKPCALFFPYWLKFSYNKTLKKLCQKHNGN